jgi:hypothetical protein
LAANPKPKDSTHKAKSSHDGTSLSSAVQAVFIPGKRAAQPLPQESAARDLEPSNFMQHAFEIYALRIDINAAARYMRNVNAGTRGKLVY